MSSSVPALGPTRRTIVRGAAWSLPVVAVAATAPAFAASTARTTITPAQPVKWSNGNEKHVSWDIAFANGPVAIDTVTITFTYAPTSAGPFTSFEIYGYPPTPTPRDLAWTYPPITSPTSVLTVTHVADIAGGATYLLHTDFAGGDNAAGKVTAQFDITYVGVSGVFSQTFGPTSWGSGSQHVHPLT